MSKEKLLGKTPEELKEVVASVGLPAYTAKQLAEWMYVKRVKSFDEMTNISKEGRRKLSENYDLGIMLPSQFIESTDGTKKYLFEFDGGGVEAVMIPDDDRKTLCVSSQVGCKMGCKFCMTGRQGFHGNLSVAEILSQFLSIDESLTLTNAVFMGMGRLLFGLYGHKLNLKKALLCCAALCIACYTVTAVSPNPLLSLFGCALTGLSVSLFWPGTFSLVSELYPKGGAAMFGVLAILGDLGCSLGPSIVSYISTAVQSVNTALTDGEALKIGLGFGNLFPIVIILGLLLLKNRKNPVDKAHR